MKNEARPPDLVDVEEHLARFLYSPFHFERRKQRIKKAAFKPPYEKDEVSVTRLDYAGIEFCTKLALEAERPEESTPKIFEGIARIRCQTILDCGAFIRFSPIEGKNPFHADIYYGQILRRDEPAPALLEARFQAMADASAFLPV